MANELNIGVKFGAEGIPEVSKSISQLDAQLKRFQKGLNTGTGVDSIARLNRAIAETKTRMENLQKFTGDAGKGFGKLVAGSNQATNALTNLSRIAQDAPFGFIGITNNINPLLESFQRLKAETGSTKTAISALGASLLGAGGLGLAVGIGSALLTVFGDKLFGIGAASKKAKDDAEELAQTIRDIALVQGEATAGVQGQIATVNALAAAVSDSNRPYAERKRALDELKEINKAYFGDLKLEDAATGALAKTVGEYTKALVANAIVKKFADEISNVALAATKADIELSKATQKLTNAEKDLAKARRESRPTGREGTGVSAEEAEANEKLIETFKEQRAQREKVTDLLDQQVLLTDKLNKAQLEALKFKDLDTPDKGKTEVDLLKKRLDALEKIKDATKDIFTITDLGEQIFDLKVKITLRDAAKNGLSKEETDLAIQGFKNQLTDAFNREALALEAIPKVKVTDVEMAPLPSGKIESEIAKATGLDKNIPIPTDRQVRIKLLGIEFVEAEEQAKAAVEKLKSTILNATVGALSDTANLFGETLGAILSGEGIGSTIAKAAEGLLRILGGALQAIGQQIIATSALVEALKKALNNLFGPGGTQIGFAVGAALIGLGGLLKNLKLPAFAGGVKNFSGGLAIVGERGPELVNLPRGSDVIPNHMIGNGQVNVTLQPSLTFDRRGLVVAIQQVLESNSRMGGATL